MFPESFAALGISYPFGEGIAIGGHNETLYSPWDTDG
jgi:hypothetical protein